MDVIVYSLVQSQRSTDVVVTECEWGKTERARRFAASYNAWLNQTEWSRNIMLVLSPSIGYTYWDIQQA